MTRDLPKSHAKLLQRGHSQTEQALYDVIKHRRLTVLFQPIIDFSNCRVIGYEGLVRGPSSGMLHSPSRLLGLARQSGVGHELENLCCQVVAEQFVELRLQGSLFLNRSSDALAVQELQGKNTVEIIQATGLDLGRVIIELTESKPVCDYDPDLLLELVTYYNTAGLRVAIDDQGECFSSLGSWLEVHPDFVKIDRHFIQNIDEDPVKIELIKSWLKIAAKAGCQVIAEGIETHSELLKVRELGVQYGQGYHICRPSKNPSLVVSAEVVKALTRHIAEEKSVTNTQAGVVERKLVSKVPCYTSATCNEELFRIFESNQQYDSIAIINDEKVPIGLINRSALIDKFARPYRRELFGKKSCTVFMETNPLIVDKNITIQELSRMVADDKRHLANGFIFTENGRYSGIGTSHELIREITEMQISAARYANPLTGLPGNIPINEHIDKLLESRVTFVACYFDLDHFKPFNDVYGFSKGDAIIQMTAKILGAGCDPEVDFLGHIGGDDFIALFCSQDWEERCRKILEKFGASVVSFFSVNDNEHGGYVTENRRGEKEFIPLTSLSIGAVYVEPGAFNSHMEVAIVATESKKMAKKISGNSLYVDKRSYPEASGPPHYRDPPE